MDLASRIGKRIRAAREKMGLTQIEVAEKLGLSGVGYGAFERGDSLIGLDYLLRLVQLLGRPITYFTEQPSLPGLTAEEEELVRMWRQITMPEIRRFLWQSMEAASAVERELGAESVTER